MVVVRSSLFCMMLVCRRRRQWCGVYGDTFSSSFFVCFAAAAAVAYRFQVCDSAFFLFFLFLLPRARLQGIEGSLQVARLLLFAVLAHDALSYRREARSLRGAAVVIRADICVGDGDVKVFAEAERGVCVVVLFGIKKHMWSSRKKRECSRKNKNNQLPDVWVFLTLIPGTCTLGRATFIGAL